MVKRVLIILKTSKKVCYNNEQNAFLHENYNYAFITFHFFFNTLNIHKN